MDRLHVVCDSHGPNLDAVREKFPDVKTCSDFTQVLSDDDVDAVVLATPAVTHAEMTIAALRAGKDVLVEKPMALSVGEGEAVLEEARKADRIVMVGHVLEYHPAVTKLYELVREGALGRTQYVYSNRLNFGKVRTEENALWSFAPHDIAMMLRIVGAEPERVVSHGGAYLDRRIADVTTTSLSFPGGIRGHIFVSWLHPFKEHRFVVVGEEQMAVLDDTRPWNEKLVLYPHRVKWMGGQVPVATRADATSVDVEEAEPLRLECEHFIESVAGRKPPLTDGESGLRVVTVLEAAQRSLESGGSESAKKVETSDVGFTAHPTATVDPGAQIGPRVRIWHYSHVMDGARIGADSVLGQNVFVARNVPVGRGVKVQNNVSLYEGVELEDHVFCGPSMVFTNVMNPRSEIERKSEFRRTLVRQGATLGANCTIVCGVEIGRYSFVGAGATVIKNVPDNALVVGVPARLVGWVCNCGERLEVQDGRPTTCAACGRTYSLKGPEELVPSAP
jgi:UDP-2-acetamido-3-amino-2,3-dideoxy-glucuronate N-acetyltransferase